MTVHTLSTAFALVTPDVIDSFVDWALNRQEIGPEALGLYPMSWLVERLPASVRDADGDIIPEAEAFFCRTTGTGSFADFMRHPGAAALLGVVS